jgi:hypothetical protein
LRSAVGLSSCLTGKDPLLLLLVIKDEDEEEPFPDPPDEELDDNINKEIIYGCL